MANLTRLTVNLVERSFKSLALATELTGDSKTDTINRAIQAYAYLLGAKANGGDVIIRDCNGEAFIVEFL